MSSGELEGQGPLKSDNCRQKPCYSKIFGNCILNSFKMLGGKRSQKVPQGTFDSCGGLLAAVDMKWGRIPTPVTSVTGSNDTLRGVQVGERCVRSQHHEFDGAGKAVRNDTGGAAEGDGVRRASLSAFCLILERPKREGCDLPSLKHPPGVGDYQIAPLPQSGKGGGGLWPLRLSKTMLQVSMSEQRGA